MKEILKGRKQQHKPRPACATCYPPAAVPDEETYAELSRYKPRELIRSCLGQYAGVEDLIHENECLALMLSAYGLFTGRSLSDDEMPQLIAGKKSDILRFLSYPPRSLGIIRKVTFESSVETLNCRDIVLALVRLRDIVRDDFMNRILGKVSAITPDVLHLAVHYYPKNRQYLNVRFLEGILISEARIGHMEEG